jgi:ubiquinone/menaquinone biosynthesis C-methylase UbiE
MDRKQPRALGDAFHLSRGADETAPPMATAWDEVQRRYYETGLEDYEAERSRRTRAYRRKARILAAVLRAAGSRSVVEVAAGSGLVTRFLLPSLPGVRYVALDFAHAMLAAARTRAGAAAQYVLADVAATGLADASVDAVVGVDILHHLGEPAAALGEWLRITRPGGTLAILESNPYHPVSLAFIGVEHELRLFMNSPRNLTAWARDAGWHDVELRTTPTFTPSGPAALGRMLDGVDRLAMHLPGARWLAALWLLAGRKPSAAGSGQESRA